MKFITQSKLIRIIAGLLILGLIIGVSLILLLPAGCHDKSTNSTLPTLPTQDDTQEPDSEPDVHTQAIEGPSIYVDVEMGDLTVTGLDVSISVNIDNPTSMALDIGDIQLSVTGDAGKVYTEGTVSGDSIAADSTSTFKYGIIIPLELITERDLLITVSTFAGVGNIIEIPLDATIRVRMPNIESFIDVPSINLSVNVGDLTNEGLHTTVQANIYNPNQFSLDMGDLQTVIEDQSGNVITGSTMTGISLGPDSMGTITGSVLMPLEVLSKEVIVLKLDTSAGIAGFTLPVSTSVTVDMPEIGELFAVPEIEILAETGIITSFPLPKLEISTTIDLTNNNNFDLTIGYLQMSIFKSDGTLITETTIQGGEIPSSGSRTFSGSVIFTAQQTASFLISDYVVMEMNSEAGISDIDMIIPFGAKIIFVPMPF